MVKRISKLILMVLGLLLLSSCQQKISSEEAGRLFIQGEFYLRENYKDRTFLRKYGQAFGEQLREDTLWETEMNTAVALAKQNVSPKIRKEIGPILSQELSEKTSFTVEKLETTEESTTISASIYGLDLVDFERQVQTSLEKSLLEEIRTNDFLEIKEIKDLSELTSSQDLAKVSEIVTEFQKDHLKQEEIILKTLPEIKKKKKATKVRLILIPGKKDNSQWELKNEEESLRELTKAFLN